VVALLHRYTLDDISAYTRTVQLEHWIEHLFSGGSENHVILESFSLQQLQKAGFSEIDLT